MKIKVADYIAEWAAEKKIRHVFTVTGGGAMHLNNAFGKHPKLKCVYNHHEQASAIAAESYARINKKIALVCVTSGPGGTNAITGVLGGWRDSIKMMIISGQVRYDTTVRSTKLKLRQLGDQEFDIAKCVSTMTKYAEMVIDPLKIKYHLEKAYFLAMNGRPGPCWLDIPLDVQGAYIETGKLARYDSTSDKKGLPGKISGSVARRVIKKIESAKRPVLFAGSAISLNGLEKKFVKMAELLNIPVVTGFNAHDCIDSSHPLFIGKQGTIGDRAGNFAVQNSDLLLVIGSRLNIRQTGYAWDTFARKALKIMVDMDPAEFEKANTKPDMGIHADAGDFIEAIIKAAVKPAKNKNRGWIEWCAERREKYPVVLPEYWKKDKPVNPYCFISVLGDKLAENSVVVAANASACICSFQALKIRIGQRLFSNSGAASMGYDLPAAIGAYYAAPGRQIICLAGDGSIQMNLQELQTIVHNKIAVKIFLFSNSGYHSIRQTQTNFFGKPLVGCEPENGVSFPDAGKIAAAYGIPYIKCGRNSLLRETVGKTLKKPGAVICEMILDPEQPFSPRASSKKLPDGRIVSRPLEDMAPFLGEEELKGNMLIDMIKE